VMHQAPFLQRELFHRLAHDDETRRHLDALFLPELEGLLIVAVKRLQRRLQSRGEFERVEFLAFTARALGPLLPRLAATLCHE
jgi:hypothetical protein